MPLLALLVSSLLISIGIAVLVWRLRGTPGMLLFSLSVGLQAVYIAASILELLAESAAGKLFWDNLQFALLGPAVILLLAFAEHYLDRSWSHPRLVYTLLSIPFFIFIFLLFSDPYHSLVRPATSLVSAGSFAVLEYPFTFVQAVFYAWLYLLLIYICVRMVIEIRSAAGLRRTQSTLILGGIGFAYIVPLLPQFGLNLGWYDDLRPLAFTLGNLVIAWGLLQNRFFNLTPLGWSQVIEQIDQGILIFDQSQRLVQVNSAARSLLGIENPTDQNQVWAADLPSELQLTRLLKSNEPSFREITLWKPEGAREIEIQAQILYPQENQPNGHLLVLTDVTDWVATHNELLGHRENLAKLVQLRTAELEKTAARLRTLREIDKAILEAKSPVAIATAALSRIRKLTGYARASLVLFDEKKDCGQILAVDSDRPTELKADTVASLEELKLLAPEIWDYQVQVVEDIRQVHQTEFTNRLRREGVQAYIAAPLHQRTKLIGMLLLAREVTGTFGPEILEIVLEIADQLAIAINQARLNEEIARYAQELEARVRERTHELETANQRLKELSEVKDAFVANVSHELRTPITSLKLYNELLLKHPATAINYIDTLVRETERLEALIEDLLTISRLDQDRVEVKFEPVDLNKLAQVYVSDRRLLAAQKKIDLQLEPARDAVFARGDANLLGQVLSILLTNAINYTPEEGQVAVRIVSGELIEHPEHVGIQVSDTGPGINEDEIQRVFDRFYRGSAGRSSEAPGTGLGLAIASEIADRHEGWIEIESSGIPGEGASFTLWLPIQAGA